MSALYQARSPSEISSHGIPLRSIRNIGSRWQLRQIDPAGNVHDVGQLHALVADQYLFRPSHAKFSALAAVTNGIPYLLQDQRPGGFLGRAVPLRFPELGLPQRVIDWTDDHYLRYLTRRGADTVGDLLLGDEACNEYIKIQKQRSPIEPEARKTEFPRLAREVMMGGL